MKGTQRLVEAARSSGIVHLVYISIVGIDDIPLTYYKRKREAEEIVRSSGVPHSILRVTQFHSFVNDLLFKAARVPLLMPLPTNFQVQSVAEQEVAQRLASCLADGPNGRVPDFGGPEVLSLGAMAQTWMDFQTARKRLVSVPLPGAVAAGFRMGKNTALNGERGVIRWREWLAQHIQKGSLS